MSLTQLPASTIKLITSSQIITSVSSAVKELFENALDAGATSVDVKLTNYGLDRIEVKDNGSGISKENTACMALPHYTSKISDFSDLESLETYGFRGEALNALCRVSQVSVTTATSKDPSAIVYTLDSSGNISGIKPSPHVQGTTVVLLSLFKNLPVRRQFMSSNRKAQEELKQVECVVKSLAVIKPSIRVTLSHNKCLIWQKTPCASLQNSFSQLIGYSTCNQLEQLSLKISSEVLVETLIPKRDCEIALVSKSTPSLSLVFVNERPVIYKKMIKILHHQLLKKFGESFPSRKFAVCLISITSNPSSIDVNLEPNKTKVLLKDEDEILSKFQKLLEDYYRIPNLNSESNEENGIGNDESTPTMIREHSPPLDLEDNLARKKRKIGDEHSYVENALAKKYVDPNTTEHHEQPSIDSPNNHSDGFTNAMKEQIDVTTSIKPALQRAECLDSQTTIINSALGNCQDKLHPTVPPVEYPSMQGILSLNDEVDTDHSNCHQDNYGAEKCDSPCENHSLHIQGELSDAQLPRPSFVSVVLHDDGGRVDIAEHQEQLHGGEKTIPLLESQNCQVNSVLSDPLASHDQGQTSSSNDTEKFWESVPADDLQELSDCLDAMVNASDSSSCVQHTEGNSFSKGVNIVASEAWSMGHITDRQGDFVKGSSVLVGGREAPLFGQIHKSPPNTISKIPGGTSNTTDTSKKISPQLSSPRETPVQNISNKLSPEMDSSLQSVSSQMGRRELAAFTKFAREVRPQIILENPGISFTRVASMLAEKWQMLSDKDREHYEQLARETATTKKIWKTADKQKKLEWVTKLPTREAKKNTQVHPKYQDRPPRREVQFTINLDRIKDKVSRAPMMIEWREHQARQSSSYHLIGHLEPSGIWICFKDTSLMFLNHSRLQEVVINHRLLNTHTLKLKPLTSWERLDHVVLGEEAWRTLISLPCKFDEFRQTKVVCADVISKNGFRIEVQEDNQSAKLTEVAETLNFYGIKELKETLHLSKNWPDVQLCHCRPLRVASHVKGEAMRICRKSPTVLQKTMVQELLDYWRTVMDPEELLCLHSKPILSSFYCLLLKKNLLSTP